MGPSWGLGAVGICSRASFLGRLVGPEMWGGRSRNKGTQRESHSLEAR